MACLAGARSLLRSSSARNAAASLASPPKCKPKASPSSPFRVSANQPLSQAFLRRPVGMSFAVESMMPYHSATASALMTSRFTVARRSYGWLPEACNDDV